MKKLLVSGMMWLSLATLALPQNKFSPTTTTAGVRYFDPTFSVTRTNDLTFGQALNASTGNMETLKLDLYQPTGDNAPSRAAIIWIHAGGFVQGDKGNSETSTRCDEFTKRGYVAASINYRLWASGDPGSPAVQQAYEDAKAAVRWLRANAATYRIDVNRISIAGTSSGAITAVHATYEESEGTSGNPGYSSEVSACIDGSGFLEFDDHIEIGEAPLLIVHGDQDTDVPYSEALELEAHALATGIPYEFHTLVGEDHSWTSAEKAQFIDWAIDFNYRYVTQTGPTGVPVATIGDLTVTEGNAGTVNAVFTVTLAAPTANGQVVTMDYATANGSATAGSDYVAKSGTLSIPAGATTQTVTIAVNGDANFEPNENFFLNLKKPANARINDLQGVATIQDDDIAGAPAAPTALAATAVSATQINLSWTDNANNEDGFRIERKTASTSFVEIATAAAQAQSYADLTVSAGTTYTYRVRAYNYSGNSDYSNEASATTTSAAVNLALNKPATASSTNGSDAPSKAVDGSTSTYWRSGSISSSTLTWLNVDLQAATNVNRVVIKWNGSYYAKKYQIQVSNDNTNWSTVYTDNAGNGGTDDYTFVATAGRYVRVYMTTNNKSSERINELEVYGTSGAAAKFDNEVAGMVALPVSVELLQNYPNPFNPQTKIRFNLPEASHVTLRVLNALGQEVALLLDEARPSGTQEVLFDAQALPSGVYFSVLQAGAEKRVQRLLLMK